MNLGIDGFSFIFMTFTTFFIPICFIVDCGMLWEVTGKSILQHL